MKTLKTMNQNDLGLLVENCPKVKISDFLRKYRMRSKENLIKSELELQGINVELGITKRVTAAQGFGLSVLSAKAGPACCLFIP